MNVLGELRMKELAELCNPTYDSGYIHFITKPILLVLVGTAE